MKLKNKKKFLLEIARSSGNPAEFIDHVRSLQNMTVQEISEKCGIRMAHFYVIMHAFRHGKSVSVSTIVKICKGLDIEPGILNTLVADYTLKMYLNKLKDNGTD